jgi:hypothetical protein
MIRPVNRVSFGPEQDDAFEAWRDGLVDEFERFSALSQLPVDPSDLGMLLDWKRNYGDGRLDRWTRVDEKRFLLEWCPRHLSATADEAQGLPATVATAMSFLATSDLLGTGSDPVEALTGYPLELAPRFRRDMDDPSNFGMAKTLFANLGLDPDQLSDPDALEQAMNSINALPLDERRRLTAGSAGGLGAGGDDPDLLDLPSIGPVVMPSPDAARDSAAVAPVLTGFDQLAEYFAAPGRPLTKAGNLRLVDARALVVQLGTGESLEHDYGDRTYRIASAAQLPQLDHWQWWAREAGALRTQRDRLIAVKAWQRRRKADPVDAVRKAFEVLLDHGVLTSYSSWLNSAVTQFLDMCAVPLLMRLLSGAQLLSETAALLRELSVDSGVHEFYPGNLDDSLESLVVLLERAGVVEHRDYTLVKRRHGESHARSGGVLSLTPVGVVVSVELAEESGIDVDVVADPSTSTVDTMAGLVESVGPEQWWELAERWLDAQPDLDPAAESLLDGLAEIAAPWQLMVLDAAPERLRSRLEPAVRRRAAAPLVTDDSSIALHWLLARGLADPTEIDPDILLDSTLVNLGMLAEASPAAVEHAIGREGRPESALEIIDATLQRMPPRGEVLLDVIGSEHTDKRVAKAARKALFRFRSKMVARTGQPSR